MARTPMDSFGKSTESLRECGTTWSQYSRSQPHPAPQAYYAQRLGHPDEGGSQSPARDKPEDHDILGSQDTLVNVDADLDVDATPT